MKHIYTAWLKDHLHPCPSTNHTEHVSRGAVPSLQWCVYIHCQLRTAVWLCACRPHTLDITHATFCRVKMAVEGHRQPTWQRTVVWVQTAILAPLCALHTVQCAMRGTCDMHVHTCSTGCHMQRHCHTHLHVRQNRCTLTTQHTCAINITDTHMEHVIHNAHTTRTLYSSLLVTEFGHHPTALRIIFKDMLTFKYVYTLHAVMMASGA